MNKISLLLIIVALISSCSRKMSSNHAKAIYKSEDLIITQVSPNVFIHTTYLQTESFGNVPCNGMIVTSENEAIVFDTPTNNENSEELISWINNKLHCKIKAVVATHFHTDCLGGLQTFYNHGVAAYANNKTIDFAKNNNESVLPNHTFSNHIILNVGNDSVIVTFFGEGHTKDNVVAYFPKEEILFGGCLVKELNASKGYLGDANVDDWSATVEKIKTTYPNLKTVIPGHGKYGNTKLLDYTIELFKK
ncbi:MAG: subclass B1 metallo-beta-lactamase [Chitinophagales bacterium]|nr:subclass B1 metallo-beta-lactamase [Chitinophagales bacterium]